MIDHAHNLHKVTNLDLEYLCDILRPTSKRVYIIVLGEKSLHKWLASSYFCFEDSWYSHDIVTLQTNNSYSSIIFNLLTVMHSRPLLQDYLETIVLEQNGYTTFNFEGVSYLRKKYCPHRGANLTNCIPDKLGQIVCPAHGWVYNIESGECIDGDSQSSIS